MIVTVSLLLLSSWLIHVPKTMRLCNSQIPEEYLVCYQTSQCNWVIIKMLYRCLRRCLLGWHRSRLGFVIRPFCIMLLYRYLLHYGLLFHIMSQYLWLFSLILQGIRRENAGSWNSRLEKEKILETYYAQLQKSWNSTEYLIINNEKSSPKMKTRGATPYPRAHPPTSWGP